MERRLFNKGKTVYYINGMRFENTGNTRDGRAKAEAYCLDNFINPSEIMRFDSRTECNRYECLCAQARAGLIDNLAHHFTLKVQDEYENANGDIIPAITYEADFIYRDLTTGQRVVEDVKGSEYFIDERFITLKQVFDKIMLPKGLYIRIMLYRNGDWVEWHIGEKKKSQKLIKKQREQLNALKQAQHEREVRERADAREKERYIQLRDMINTGVKLTSAQKKRFSELCKKFEVDNGR